MRRDLDRTTDELGGFDLPELCRAGAVTCERLANRKRTITDGSKFSPFNYRSAPCGSTSMAARRVEKLKFWRAEGKVRGGLLASTKLTGPRLAMAKRSGSSRRPFSIVRMERPDMDEPGPGQSIDDFENDRRRPGWPEAAGPPAELGVQIFSIARKK